MAYLIIVLVAAAVLFVAYKGFIAGQANRPEGPAARRDAPRGPDDDPDFLRKL